MSDLLNSASLVLIPSGYKEDTVYSVVPSDGSGDLSFTRASNGTRVNSAGLVEVTPWNLLTYSSVLSDSSYNIGEVTASYSQTDPKGGTTGALFTGVSATNAFIIKPFTTIIGQVYTCFVYLKGNSSGSVSLRAEGATSAPVNNVNYTTSYQQFTYTFTANSTTTNLIIGGFGSWRGSEAIYIAFPQANIGSTAKPYFPTTDRLNVPRLTYQNGGGGCPSLLLEKQSTNLVSYSEELDNAAWIKNNTTVTANATTSPDGTINADKIADSINTSSAFYFYQSPATTSTQYTSSGYFKKGEYNFVTLHAFGLNGAVFNLNTGVLVSQSGGTGTIQTVGDGWYRCTFTFVAVGSAVFFSQSPAGNISYTGTIGSGIYGWGLQVEASSYATSLIPTTSASATRVADACSKTGISSLIGQTEGVWFADYVLNGQTNNANILNSEKNTTCALFMSQQADGDFDAGLYVSGSLVGRIVAPVGLTVGQRVKVAYAYKSGSFALYINGNQEGILSNTFTFPTTLDDIFLGDEVYFNYPESVKFNQVAIFPTRLTNAELASLTTI